MLLEPENWYLGYSQIAKDCREPDRGDQQVSSSSCLILCRADVDAMAAARIWAYMLRNDGIAFQLHPCNSYSDLVRILSSAVVRDDVRAVVLLNMGSCQNLTKLLFAPRPQQPDHGGADDDDRRYDESEADEENNNSNGMSPPLLSLGTKVYVLDCRRPVHLANVYAGDNVVVFWDSVQRQYQREELPSDGDNLSGDDSTSSEEDDTDYDENSEDANDRDDDDEHEFGEEKSNENQADAVEDDNIDDQFSIDAEGQHVHGRSSPRQEDQESEYDADQEEADDNRRRLKKQRSLVEREEDAGDASTNSGSDKNRGSSNSDDDSGYDLSPSRKRDTELDQTVNTATTLDTENSQMPSLTANELHKRRRQRLRAYYASGSFYGSPASYVAYRVSTQLRFGDVGDLLWFACVGVTDAYLHARLDMAGYTSLAMDLRGHCSRLFPNDMYSRVESSVFAERLEGSANELTKIGFSENGRILSEMDFRFFLLRHSSLFDAMRYSDFVSTKLQLLTSRGMHRLQELLAKMGYPLEECYQPFTFMKTSLRRRLSERIRAHAEEYGLENIEFTSFFRVTGYQSLLSASDTSYAVTALLEREQPTQSSEEHDDRGTFNVAFDVLNTNSTPSSICLHGSSNLSGLVNGTTLPSSGLGEGIRLAIQFQKNIFATTANLIDRNAITRLSHFRYAYITCTSTNHHDQHQRRSLFEDGSMTSESPPHQHHIFSKPLALTRLAHYLMDWHRENGKWVGNKARPLILCAEKPPSSFLVAGFEYPESKGHFVANRFGKNFELAAASMQGTFRFDGFDSHVVEVAGSDVQRFIEQLHYLMESSMSVVPDLE
jgi:cell division control protein 45